MGKDRTPLSDERIAKMRENYERSLPVSKRANRAFLVDFLRDAPLLFAEIERLQEELRYKEELLDKAAHQIVALSPNITWHE